VVPSGLEGLDQLFQEGSVAPYSQSFDVLEHEVRRFEFAYETDEFPNECIARIIEQALSDEGKTLAGSAAKDDIDSPTPKLGGLPKLPRRQADDGLGNDCTVGEVVLVDRGMHGVDLDCGRNVEAGLFEAQTQPPRSRE
jgi:hypothetical protein